MDCIEAQGLISAAMDRAPIPASSLAEAKEHCRTCPQCSAFVSTQLATRQAHLPEPPADLADRTMARIRAEAETMAAEKAAAAAVATEAAETADSPAALGVPTREIHVPAFVNPTLAPKPKKERGLGRKWPSIAVAAAVVVAMVGTGAVVTFGMRLISSMNSEADRGAYTFDGKASSAAPEAGLAPAQAPGGRTPGPNAVTVKGMVYVRGESSDIDTSTLTEAGTFSSGLDSDSPSTRTAYRSRDDDSKIYVDDDAGTTWEFAPVTREYFGDTYALVSKELTRFGQWPTLPKGIDAPANDQGGTTFTKRGTDNTGARVYVPSAPLAGYGSEVAIPGVSSAPPMIALPPRSAGDILADDPNWTLWLQLP